MKYRWYRCGCYHSSIWNAKIIKHFSGMRKNFDRQIKIAVWNMSIGKCVRRGYVFHYVFQWTNALFIFCLKFRCVASDWRNAFELYTIFHCSKCIFCWIQSTLLVLCETVLYAESIALSYKVSNVIFDMCSNLYTCICISNYISRYYVCLSTM